MGESHLNQKEQHALKSGRLLYSVKDTAFLLSISQKSVRRLIERGLLKTNPALRIRLITRESIEAFAKVTL
jgi:hypothetical protein